MVALSRHSDASMTPPLGAEEIVGEREVLEQRLLGAFRDRVRQQSFPDEAEREERLRSVQNRVVDLLDSWRNVLADYQSANVRLQYQKYEKDGPKPLLRDLLDEEFETEHHRKFRVGRSLRDVEPEVNLFVKDLSDSQAETS